LEETPFASYLKTTTYSFVVASKVTGSVSVIVPLALGLPSYPVTKLIF
jgi:hypothetical protein